MIKFKDEAEALKIANDTLYGLGAAVWTRNGNIAHRMGRAIQAGIVWTNCSTHIQLTLHLVVTNNQVLEEKLTR